MEKRRQLCHDCINQIFKKLGKNPVIKNLQHYITFRKPVHGPHKKFSIVACGTRAAIRWSLIHYFETTLPRYFIFAEMLFLAYYHCDVYKFLFYNEIFKTIIKKNQQKHIIKECVKNKNVVVLRLTGKIVFYQKLEGLQAIYHFL